ncbi:UNVERIFIED_CONTAM: hypothetical protein HDU68_009652 [Siphonaria sp. JEL0065]|nr:hypothetical protein HDU68_009652 [Siphonaria sp. JEL0065]
MSAPTSVLNAIATATRSTTFATGTLAVSGSNSSSSGNGTEPFTGHTWAHPAAIAFSLVGLIFNVVLAFAIVRSPVLRRNYNAHAAASREKTGSAASLTNNASLHAATATTATATTNENASTASVAEEPLPQEPHRAIDPSVLNYTVLAIVVICALEAILIIMSNIFNLTWTIGGPTQYKSEGLPTSEVIERFVCVLGGYLLVCLLFAVNLVLALERHWVIRYARSLSRQAVVGVMLSGVLAFGLFLATFVYSFLVSCGGTGGMNVKFGRPFAMPGNPRNIILKTLFLTGMCYFPVVIVLIVGLYTSSYRLVSVLVQENYQMQMGDSVDDDESVAHDSSISSNTNKQKRAVLLRCTLMSIGCLLFYAPTIVAIFVDRLSPLPSTGSSSTGSTNGTASSNSTKPGTVVSVTFTKFNCTVVTDVPEATLLVPIATILPALDVIWTPLLILWVQTLHRTIFFKFLRESWNSIFRKDDD